MTQPIGMARPAAALFCALVLLPGCGGGDSRAQKTYKVSGTVLLDGKPYKGAQVAFVPKDAAKFVMNERPQAITDADGKFVLSTYNTGDGAPAGEYFVGIQTGDGSAGREDEGSDQVRRTKGPRVPQKYVKPQESGIVVRVEEKNNEVPPFELTSKK